MYKQIVPVEDHNSYLIGVFLDHVDEEGMPDIQLCAAPKNRVFRIGEPTVIEIMFVKTKGFTKPLVSKKKFRMEIRSKTI